MSQSIVAETAEVQHSLMRVSEHPCYFKLSSLLKETFRAPKLSEDLVCSSLVKFLENPSSRTMCNKKNSLNDYITGKYYEILKIQCFRFAKFLSGKYIETR